ncbi:alpha/beta hydrolase [Nocardia seriolae]|nr:alpha/beta hydrolase family protein [Nocardia seriolae]MTJ64034.1 esterase family protein [Nocardia seriolae]MTJ71298.1 esterase family protein [Nocardia seriolae]MTJ88595.1 esterase family protein [Nocardia seriolae]MTK32579.1 esterase family protein [Nocardia seriolae]MTK41920.1 esterase family protein [Nocardia seriolae]
MCSVAVLPAAALVALSATPFDLPAAAEPDVITSGSATSFAAPDGSAIVATRAVDARHLELTVHSAAMNIDFPVEVQRPADTSVPRPVLYLLSGGSGGKGAASWEHRTNAFDFLADKDVNVVQPIGGAASYYADWRTPDPRLGLVKWTTYLTRELPPLIDAALGASGVNGLVGVSMSGTSVLQLPIAAPGLYRSVAAYSGCARIADPIGQAFVRITVGFGGGDAGNMYGAPADPQWAANDPYLHADALRGLDLYLSSGNGMPGPHDDAGDRHFAGSTDNLANQILVGGILEAAVDQCTREMASRLDELGIPVTVALHPYGTHSWGYWDDELPASWPVLAHGLGV